MEHIKPWWIPMFDRVVEIFVALALGGLIVCALAWTTLRSGWKAEVREAVDRTLIVHALDEKGGSSVLFVPDAERFRKGQRVSVLEFRGRVIVTPLD